MPTVNIPPRYRGPTEGEFSIFTDATTIRESVVAIDKRYPGFAELVIDKETGDLRRGVKVALNGDVLLPDDGIDNQIDINDDIKIITAAIGG